MELSSSLEGDDRSGTTVRPELVEGLITTVARGASGVLYIHGHTPFALRPAQGERSECPTTRGSGANL